MVPINGIDHQGVKVRAGSFSIEALGRAILRIKGAFGVR
jgi:hypothetical protein